jgi:CxxC motif-containing protein (DUF1111 family)
MITGLTGNQPFFFSDGKADFLEIEEIDEGLGPRFNLNGCGPCHSQPATGGSSPAVNPQFTLATTPPFNLRNDPPSFITAKGPVREARFVKNPDGSPDGGVHALFVISGAPGAENCTARQEDFETQIRNRNIIFRIPTPTFGAGLIEAIPDRVIRDNLAAMAAQKSQFGIFSKFNTMNISGDGNNNGNDGTIARFGWKAQNKSLLLFSGEAYNVEMGITNELFQTERDENPTCQFAKVPNDITNTNGTGFHGGTDTISAIEKFAFFMRFLAPPTPVSSYQSQNVGFVNSTSINDGKQIFTNIGCNLCHTPSLKTGDSPIAALNNKTANLYSDIGIHQMGPGLADRISQGQANGDEFRTAPLWGVGQRIFFLHDGRTMDIKEAIQQHRSSGDSQFGPSEANRVIDNFNNLREDDKQDLLNFLRSL